MALHVGVVVTDGLSDGGDVSRLGSIISLRSGGLRRILRSFVLDAKEIVGLGQGVILSNLDGVGRQGQEAGNENRAHSSSVVVSRAEISTD